MKKTITVNISGVVFSIDEDAHQMLENYLFDIESRLNAQNEDSETIRDIESRIMEIFREHEKNSYFVVNIELVKKVIATIGAPSIFGDQDYTQTKASNRLMRDPINNIFGGVCSGLAHYLNVNVVALRVVVVVFSFFAGILAVAYIIMWAILPEAKTKEEISMFKSCGRARN